MKAHKSENLVSKFNTLTHSKLDLNIEAVSIHNTNNQSKLSFA